MKSTLIAVALLVEAVTAFPFVMNAPGVDSSLLRKHHNKRQQQGVTVCPANPNKHVPAVGIVEPYTYNNAKNGQMGNQKGGYRVPDPDDEAHQFQEPGPLDIRGPCPGLNAAANHGFLARDGIVTFSELVDAQQNLYNVGYDLANLLAVLGLTLTDGDIVTERLSIGCDATSRTSFAPVLTGSQPGLDGHNKFEADTSLTRNDFFLADGDNHSFNGTLFGMMQDTCQGNFNRDNLAKYRYERYQQSLKDNEQFFFGPLSLLLFGASSFLYELMPSGPDYIPDLATISSFFGTEQNDAGEWVFNNREKIPDEWYNRVEPYTNNDVTSEILAQYLEYPVLFGGATGPGTYLALPTDFGSIKEGKLTPISPTDTSCLLYQLATGNIPSSLNGIVTPTVETLAWVLKKLDPSFANLGCKTPLT